MKLGHKGSLSRRQRIPRGAVGGWILAETLIGLAVLSITVATVSPLVATAMRNARRTTEELQEVLSHTNAVRAAYALSDRGNTPREIASFIDSHYPSVEVRLERDAIYIGEQPVLLGDHR